MSATNFPHNFLESLRGIPGLEVDNFIAAHQNLPAPTSIRINPFKKSDLLIGETIPWYSQGLYLEQRPSFIFDPLFHAGCYYVQEASSMFIGHIFNLIKADSPLKVLDLCAAPGGKSTLISAALNAEDLLVANEIIKTRVSILADNLNKWGPGNTVVTNNDAQDFARLKGFFDIILIDAPCSGSGMFRKDVHSMEEWSEANVTLCYQRQKRILADVYPALKQDGYIIYSTCSYSKEENEDILDWLCDEFEMESVQIPIEKDWGIVETQADQSKAYGYRFYPDKVKGEGLFAACLRKRQPADEPQFKYRSQKTAPNKDIPYFTPFINDAEKYYYFQINEDWLAIDKVHVNDLHYLQHHLYLKKAGVKIGRIAGKDLLPDHQLALSLLVNREQTHLLELTQTQAIQYLQRENVDDIVDAYRGWALMTFNGHALGWAKLLDNRMNNYFPKELRILKRA
jgi:16S rRNA C967 or C1407 C5-methylase (RsmB/RsmF family)/NOL1/NOP2/fmu family ribosome biogenesis protein